MKKITRTYPKGCDWCNATGFVKNAYKLETTSSLTDACPVCHGNKTIMVTETIEGIMEEVILKIKVEKEGGTVHPIEFC